LGLIHIACTAHCQLRDADLCLASAPDALLTCPQLRGECMHFMDYRISSARSRHTFG
jgi:hypothetical protein